MPLSLWPTSKELTEEVGKRLVYVLVALMDVKPKGLRLTGDQCEIWVAISREWDVSKQRLHVGWDVSKEVFAEERKIFSESDRL